MVPSQQTMHREILGKAELWELVLDTWVVCGLFTKGHSEVVFLGSLQIVN